MDEHKDDSTGLKKSLSLSQLIFYGVGTILGLGIYVLLGKVAGEAGMLAPFSFLFAAIIAAFTGVSYGELSARIPKSAGEVNYVDEAFGKRYLSILVGWLIIISAIVSTATVVNGYVGYVHVFVEIPDYIIISGIILILGTIAIWGNDTKLQLERLEAYHAGSFSGVLYIYRLSGYGERCRRGKEP